jgi:hypothetical protein
VRPYVQNCYNCKKFGHVARVGQRNNYVVVEESDEACCCDGKHVSGVPCVDEGGCSSSDQGHLAGLLCGGSGNSWSE